MYNEFRELALEDAKVGYRYVIHDDGIRQEHFNLPPCCDLQVRIGVSLQVLQLRTGKEVSSGSVQ